jgi:hypothetical protein
MLENAQVDNPGVSQRLFIAFTLLSTLAKQLQRNQKQPIFFTVITVAKRHCVRVSLLPDGLKSIGNHTMFGFSCRLVAERQQGFCEYPIVPKKEKKEVISC